MKFSTLKIETIEELMAKEKEIVERINKVPNGGNLFVAHPFMLFEDIDVVLDVQVREGLFQRIPLLGRGFKPHLYKAIKKNKGKEKVKIRVKGLFKKDLLKPDAPRPRGEVTFKGESKFMRFKVPPKKISAGAEKTPIPTITQPEQYRAPSRTPASTTAKKPVRKPEVIRTKGPTRKPAPTTAKKPIRKPETSRIQTSTRKLTTTDKKKPSSGKTTPTRQKILRARRATVMRQKVKAAQKAALVSDKASKAQGKTPERGKAAPTKKKPSEKKKDSSIKTKLDPKKIGAVIKRPLRRLKKKKGGKDK